jgi:predicted PurR-regulated permease PerM
LDADPVMGVAKVIVVFVIVQGIEGNFLSPKIVGQRVGLHPGWVMFALVMFAHFWGFIGMVIAIPVAAVINILVRIVTTRYFNSNYYQHDANDEMI